MCKYIIFWFSEQFWILLPDCILVLVSEIFVDWIKHAFISRFNELQPEIYKEYTISLAYDVAKTRQKYVRFFSYDIFFIYIKCKKKYFKMFLCLPFILLKAKN